MLYALLRASLPQKAKGDCQLATPDITCRKMAMKIQSIGPSLYGVKGPPSGSDVAGAARCVSKKASRLLYRPSARRTLLKVLLLFKQHRAETAAAFVDFSLSLKFNLKIIQLYIIFFHSHLVTTLPGGLSLESCFSKMEASVTILGSSCARGPRRWEPL